MRMALLQTWACLDSPLWSCNWQIICHFLKSFVWSLLQLLQSGNFKWGSALHCKFATVSDKGSNTMHYCRVEILMGPPSIVSLQVSETKVQTPLLQSWNFNGTQHCKFASVRDWGGSPDGASVLVGRIHLRTCFTAMRRGITMQWGLLCEYVNMWMKEKGWWWR